MYTKFKGNPMQVLLYRFVCRNLLVLLYSGISIKWTHHKVDVPVSLGTERFPGETLI